MSYSLINGAVGKNPMIDKINRLPAGEALNRAAEQMEDLVCERKSVKYSSLPVTFSECKKETKRQLESRRRESRWN